MNSSCYPLCMTLSTTLSMLLLGACGESTGPASTVTAESAATVVAALAGCVDEVAIAYLCGPVNAEDLLALGTTGLLLASGMNGELSNSSSINSRIHLVNPAQRSWQELFPGPAPVFEQNMELFADCPGPLDAGNFSSHGLALQRLDRGPQQFHLYMTSHGAREAVEVFEIDALLQPTIKWIGCVPMPATSWTNSVAILRDGGFVATQFMDPTGSGMAGVLRREITGHVFEWHPGGAVSVIPGTELSGPNGIAISEDDRYMFVAAFGSREVVRFDRATTPPEKESVQVAVAPDNIRWTADGTLYTAGGNVTEDCGGPDCGTGWSVIEIVPWSLQARRLTGADETVAMQGVSSALLVGDEIWIGSYSGDRLGILPKP
jgi:hypothetical protein